MMITIMNWDFVHTFFNTWKIEEVIQKHQLRKRENMFCTKRLKELNYVGLLKHILKGASVVMCKWIHTEKILGIKVLCSLA